MDALNVIVPDDEIVRVRLYVFEPLGSPDRVSVPVPSYDREGEFVIDKR